MTNENKDYRDEQRELLNNTKEEFSNGIDDGMETSRFNNDPSDGENIENQVKSSKFTATPGWDEPIDIKNTKFYTYGETVKNVDTSQFYTEAGTLDVPHPSHDQLKREWDKRYPKVNGIPIVGVKKNGDDDIVEFKLATGQVLSYKEMLRPDVELEGIVIGENRQHELTLRSAPDGFRSNNLDQLPEYE